MKEEELFTKRKRKIPKKTGADLQKEKHLKIWSQQSAAEINF
jgi:hypothetical protein